MFIIMGTGGGIRPFPTQLPMMNGFKNYKGKIKKINLGKIFGLFIA